MVVPLYNHVRYIECCLDSIRNCGYRPLEVLVLDDGSTDNSFEVAQAWAGRCVEQGMKFHVARQTNQGLPKTLNRLVARAAGQFILIIASDDYLLPGGVDLRVGALLAHPSWLAVFADAIVVDEAGRKIHESALRDLLRSDKRALANPRTIAMELILRWGVPGGTLLVRRSAYDPVVGVGPYDESLPFEDRDFHLKALARRGVGFIDSTVSAYRLHGENFSRLKDPQALGPFYYGLYRCEITNARRHRGMARLALWLSAQRALDAARRCRGDRGLSPVLRIVLGKALSLLYWVHRLWGWIRRG
ncbi:MAG: glycosyltransferase [Verrucomicrobia bacterium]|nr:glycosyltransferase [Verrucomicrobiota bacterium]